MLSEAAASRDGGAAGAGEVVAIVAGDALDDGELAQADEVASEGGGGAWSEQRQEVARRRPAILKAGRCKAESRVCSARLKKLRPLTVRPLWECGWVRRSSARMPAEKSSRLERYSR